MHNNRFFSLVVLAAITIVGNPSCSGSRNALPQLSQSGSRSSQSQSETPAAISSSAIRSIDFANFTYPWVPTLGNPKKTFTLEHGTYIGKNGELPTGLFSITYGDLTNDNKEEAIVVLDVTVKGGSASPNIVYLYSLTDSTSPKLLWAFSTGDRRDGGLRRVYSENGKLIVELYGKSKIIGADLYSDDGTQTETPFPYYYTRVRYSWNDSKFQRIDPIENISDPKDYGIPIMPKFRLQ
jgi:hypothetical protein